MICFDCHAGDHGKCRMARRENCDCNLCVVSTTLRDHFPTKGMKVSMGETCACGQWCQGNHPKGDDLIGHQARMVLAALGIRTDRHGSSPDRTRDPSDYGYG